MELFIVDVIIALMSVIGYYTQYIVHKKTVWPNPFTPDYFTETW